ncbi:MAG TPA: hypothetical protein VM554_12795 [Acidisarcina sp.]|nr:hypothetical protein [Acidisarcina sp.]
MTRAETYTWVRRSKLSGWFLVDGVEIGVERHGTCGHHHVSLDSALNCPYAGGRLEGSHSYNPFTEEQWADAYARREAARLAARSYMQVVEDEDEERRADRQAAEFAEFMADEDRQAAESEDFMADPENWV